MSDARAFAELRDEGLLWLINVSVFHPRGYALALHYERDDPDDLGECIGWSILGDGSESWTMGDPPPERIAAGDPTCDELFRRAANLLRPFGTCDRCATAEAERGEMLAGNDAPSIARLARERDAALARVAELEGALRKIVEQKEGPLDTYRGAYAIAKEALGDA